MHGHPTSLILWRPEWKGIGRRDLKPANASAAPNSSGYAGDMLDLVARLLELEADVKRETGTSPAITVTIHSAYYDDIVATMTERHGRILSSPQAGGPEEMRLGAYNDIVIRPQRATKTS